jgi:hypothetical protein
MVRTKKCTGDFTAVDEKMFLFADRRSGRLDSGICGVTFRISEFPGNHDGDHDHP